MAIIDLRDLVEEPYDTVKIKGAKDGKDYILPVKTTLKTTLYSQKDMADLLKIKNTMSDVDYSLEASYVHIASWVRSYYPEVDIKWVKENVVDERVMAQLVNCAMRIFYPEPVKKQRETGKPKRSRKNRLS